MAPDVGALFEYGLNSFGTGPASYRVNSWMRVRPWSADSYDMLMAGAMPSEIGQNEWVVEAIHEIVSESAEHKQPSLVWCSRESATHVCGSGIAGVIAPISKIKVTGMVSWSKEVLDEARRSAMHFAQRDCPYSGW